MKSQRVLGIDWGSKRIGIAISDPDRTVAANSFTYLRKGANDDLEYLKAIIADNNVGLVVVGMPVRFDGGAGEIANKVQGFINQLEEHLSVPIETVDERLTSAEAERVLLTSDLSREDRKKHRDKLAATLILQRYLDRNKG